MFCDSMDLIEHVKQSSESYRRTVREHSKPIILIDAETAARLKQQERRMQLLSTIICVYRGKADEGEERTSMEDWHYERSGGSVSRESGGGKGIERFTFKGLETSVVEPIEEIKGIIFRKTISKGYYFPEWDISISAGAMEVIMEYYSMHRL